MTDVAFIKELPFSIQIALNIAIFLVTMIIGLKSYYSGKKEPEKDVIVTATNSKIIEEMKDNFDSMVEDVNRIADCMEGIEKHLSEIVKNSEIDREVRRITGERKRGSKGISEISLDKPVEDE